MKVKQAVSGAGPGGGGRAEQPGLHSCGRHSHSHISSEASTQSLFLSHTMRPGIICSRRLPRIRLRTPNLSSGSETLIQAQKPRIFDFMCRTDRNPETLLTFRGFRYPESIIGFRLRNLDAKRAKKRVGPTFCK